MDIVLLSFYVLVLVGFVLFTLVVEKYKRKAVIQQERAHHLDDILSSAPEGFYCEIKSATQTQSLCSRRLCLMLNLVDTSSDFKSIISVLSEPSRKELEAAWNTLLETGQSFEKTVQNTLSLMHFKVTGSLLETPYSDQHAFVLWFENISYQTAQFTENILKVNHLKNETEMFSAALTQLPFPISIERKELGLIFKNQIPIQETEEQADLHWQVVPFKTPQGDAYTLRYGQDKSMEDRLSAQISDMERATKLALKELPCGICIFDANTKLIFHNKAFADLWKLDGAWLKKEPFYDDFLNKIQEKGYLPQVKDFAQYKKVQKDLFARLTKPNEDYIYLENGRLVRRLMVPFAKGGVLFIDEDKGHR